MRMIVIKQDTDLRALTSKLFAAAPTAGTDSTLDRVKALNPHVDLQKIAAGSILLLPDSPVLSNTETQPLGAESFNAFTVSVASGFDTAAQSAQASADTLVASNSAVSAALRAPMVKRLIESDSSLQQQFDQANKQLAAEQAQAQEAVKQIQALRGPAMAELAGLARWFK